MKLLKSPYKFGGAKSKVECQENACFLQTLIIHVTQPLVCGLVVDRGIHCPKENENQGYEWLGRNERCRSLLAFS